jgi:AraC-like DNA-binding protein
MRGVTVEELAKNPVGAYVRGETFVHGCVHPSLWALLLWGRPTEDHAMVLYRSLKLELEPPAVPHAKIIDASRLEGSDPIAFRLLERYLSAFADALGRWVVKTALVRPAGLSGAMVSGVYEVLPAPYPVEVFADAGEALAWLGKTVSFTPSPAEIAATLGSLCESAEATPPVVGALSILLDAHLAGMSLPDAARALGMSERTLQRRLGDAHTTFQDQMADARVRAAQRLLVESDAPVTTIALEVGCSSPQHLGTLFRRRTGLSPSEWRKSATRGTESKT